MGDEHQQDQMTNNRCKAWVQPNLLYGPLTLYEVLNTIPKKHQKDIMSGIYAQIARCPTMHVLQALGHTVPFSNLHLSTLYLVGEPKITKTRLVKFSR